MAKHDYEFDEATLTLEKTELKKPSMYKVILHNDDYTPMDFVVMVLESVFHKKHEDAVQIMLAVHRQGIGLCGMGTQREAEQRHNGVRGRPQVRTGRSPGH